MKIESAEDIDIIKGIKLNAKIKAIESAKKVLSHKYAESKLMPRDKLVQEGINMNMNSVMQILDEFISNLKNKQT